MIVDKGHMRKCARQNIPECTMYEFKYMQLNGQPQLPRLTDIYHATAGTNVKGETHDRYVLRLFLAARLALLVRLLGAVALSKSVMVIGGGMKEPLADSPVS